jgi:hypothetical protein
MPTFKIVTRQPIKLSLFHKLEAKSENEARERAARAAHDLLKAVDAVGVEFDDSYESSSESVECIFKS